MRTDAAGTTNHMHFHDGGTCHGAPTFLECALHAVANEWVGKILEREDAYADGRVVRCYSLVGSHFDHHGRSGKFVAEVRLVVVPIDRL